MEKKYTPDKKGWVQEVNGWYQVHIEGKPEERDWQHGWLLSEYISKCIEEISQLCYVETGLEWQFYCQKANEMWYDKLGDEFTKELEGIAAGVSEVAGRSIAIDELLAWNGYEELTDYWLPTVANEIYAGIGHGGIPTPKNFQKGAQDRCSAFIATGSYTADGNIVMAHNSFTPFEVGNYLNVILDVWPDQGNHFIMQSQPGYIHSFSDFYVINNRFLVTETTIGGFCVYDSSGVPEFVRIRRAVQYANTLDDITTVLLDGNNGGYANTWLTGDIQTGEIRRLELGLKFFKEDKTMDGYFAGFNAPLDPRIRNFECTNSGFADIRRHQGSRQVRIPQLMEKYKGCINSDVGKIILADHYDIYYEEEDHPSSRTVCSHYELDDRSCMSQAGRPVPYTPRGAVDGVVCSANEAQNNHLWGRFGSSCGMAFDAKAFLEKHPQFNYLRPFLKDRPSQEWTIF